MKTRAALEAILFVTESPVPIEEPRAAVTEALSGVMAGTRPDVTEAEGLLLVRVRMPPGKGHAFHRHPAMEEIIYVVSGTAEQWVERESRLLGPGETAHIPANLVHGTYNAGNDTLVFLAILSPAIFDGPALVDVHTEEPWRSLKTPMTFTE